MLGTRRPSSKAAENTRKKPLRKQLLPAQGQMEEEEKEEEEEEDEHDPASKKPGATDSAAPIRKQRVICIFPAFAAVVVSQLLFVVAMLSG